MNSLYIRDSSVVEAEGGVNVNSQLKRFSRADSKGRKAYCRNMFQLVSQKVQKVYSNSKLNTK